MKIKKSIENMRFDIYMVKQGPHAFFRIPGSGIIIWLIIMILAWNLYLGIFGVKTESVMECVTADGQDKECINTSIIKRVRY